MFDANRVSKLSIPAWESIYRAEIYPGVVAIIAIHDLTRGWALGGCRMASYPNEAEALTDVLRLSRGMTFKNAIANLPLGGGKSVIVCDPKIAGAERERILEEFGKFVDWVNRDKLRYCTAEDMNTTLDDMNVVARHTDNIHGVTVDPSPHTAWGVFCAIEHAVDFFARDFFGGMGSLAGKRVLVQGLGKVGWDLSEHLHAAGAQLLVSDIRESVLEQAKERFSGVQVVPIDEVVTADIDVFAPCARGGVIGSGELDGLRCKIICGSANNQLETSLIGRELHRRKIVYCPDYIANMGGVCCIQYLEIQKLSVEENQALIKATVRNMLDQTFKTGFHDNVPFNISVDRVVKGLVWGEKSRDSSFSNKEQFPLTYEAISNDHVTV